MKKLWKKLNISEHERPRIVFLWKIRFLYQIGFILAWTVSTAIFLEIFGIENLLYLFLADAWLTLIGSYATHFIFLKIQTNYFLNTTLFGTALFVILAWIFKENVILFFTFVVLAKDLFYGQLNIGLYRKSESLLSPSDAQKFMPIIDSAVTLGTIAASIVFLGLLTLFETKTVLFFWIVPIFLMFWLIAISPKLLQEIPQFTEENVEINDKNNLDEAISAVKKIPFLRYMGIFIVLQTALFTIIDFEFLKYIKEKATHHELHFPIQALQTNIFNHSEKIWESVSREVYEVTNLISSTFVHTSIASELGFLAFIFGAIALIVQGFLATKILQKIGVIYSMLLFLGGLFGMVATFFAGGVNMKFVRGYQHGFEALFDSAYHLTFYSIFSHKRESIRHFFEGFVRPAGMIFGVGLLVGSQIFWVENESALLMMALCGTLMGICLPLKRYYTHTSKQNLSLSLNTEAKLHSIEILTQKGHLLAVETLSEELLNHQNHPIIREKIVVAASIINDPKIVHAYLKVLANPQEELEIKIQILESLIKLDSLKKYWHDHIFAQHHLLETLKRLFDEAKHQHLQKLIIMALFKHLPQDKVVPLFLEMLSLDNEELKSVCLRSAGEIFKDPEVVYYVKKYLNDKNHKIRGYALIALWNFEDRKNLEKILEDLIASNQEESIITALYAIGEVRDKKQEKILFSFLTHPSNEIQLHALIALAKLENPECIPPLLKILFGNDERQSKRAFFMLKRAPEILDLLKQEIQFEVSNRVMHLLIQEKITHRSHLRTLSSEHKNHLKRLFRLAEKYNEILILETENN